MSQPPLVSVVMPAFNSARWIGEAADSILSQSLRDLELIVVDDASTDCTAEIVSSIADNRVRLVRLERNSGSAVARNRAIEVARGEFVALMDSDDIALSHWLESQVRYLRCNPECGLRGGWVRVFGALDGVWTSYESHEHIKADLLFRCGMIQNTIVFRREQMRKFQLRYNDNFTVSQDYEFWTRCIEKIRFSNAQEVMALYRIHNHNSSFRKKDNVIKATREIRIRQLNKLGIVPTDYELAIHEKLGEYGSSGPRSRSFDVESLESWLLKLFSKNLEVNYFSNEALGLLLYEYWRRCCKFNSSIIDFSFARFLASRLGAGVTFRRRLTDAVKIVLGKPLYSVPRS